MDGETHEQVCLGAVAGAHGIKGEVRIKVFGERADDFASYGPLKSEDGAQRFEIVRSRVSGPVVVAKIKGVNDRTTAEKLKGERLYIERSSLPEPEEEEWYHADLIGLRVEQPDGTRLGTIVAVHDFGAGDLIEVKPDDGGATEMIPFTRAHVPVVDVAARRVVAEPLEYIEDDPAESGEEAQEGNEDAGTTGRPETG